VRAPCTPFGDSTRCLVRSIERVPGGRRPPVPGLPLEVRVLIFVIKSWAEVDRSVKSDNNCAAAWLPTVASGIERAWFAAEAVRGRRSTLRCPQGTKERARDRPAAAFQAAEHVHVYWIGLLVGLSIAAPLGPVNVLCIRRTLSGGFVLGMVSGCGAALADTFYGAVAAFGIGVVARFLLAHETMLRLGGGLVLCLLGARSLRGEVAWAQPGVGAQGLVSAFVSTFFLTLTNPLVLLTIAAVSTALGLAAEALDPAAAAAVVLGVCSGSLLWWLVLLSCVRLGSQRFNERTLRWVYRGSGGLLFVAGLALLASLAFSS